MLVLFIVGLFIAITSLITGFILTLYAVVVALNTSPAGIKVLNEWRMEIYVKKLKKLKKRYGFIVFDGVL